MSGLEAALFATMEKFLIRLALVTSLLLNKKKSFYITITSGNGIQPANQFLSSGKVKYPVLQIKNFSLTSRSTTLKIMASC
jgi:hypothetical protein